MLPARRFAPLALVSPPSRRAPEPEYLNRPGIISESTRAGSYGTHALRHPLHGSGTASGATWATFGTGCVLLSYYFRATSGGSPPQSLAVAKVHPSRCRPDGTDSGERLAGSMGRDECDRPPLAITGRTPPGSPKPSSGVRPVTLPALRASQRGAAAKPRYRSSGDEDRGIAHLECRTAHTTLPPVSPLASGRRDQPLPEHTLGRASRLPSLPAHTSMRCKSRYASRDPVQ